VKPLHKVASGGELSRLMLGLKTVFTGLWGSEVIIFDEIDAGVSGSAARSIGEKMRKISRFAQVFAVTHLSAVAAYADQHYKVEKETRNNETFTSIRVLNEEEKIDELAIMNTGSLTETSRKAAMELRESVKHAR
ncbi:MAG: DNA repair protein RecN, partial [Erysipelotrichales bacterium]|nr:DNA repair protein RecN [Erysipelotrichales bacterium]